MFPTNFPHVAVVLMFYSPFCPSQKLWSTCEVVVSWGFLGRSSAACLKMTAMLILIELHTYGHFPSEA